MDQLVACLDDCRGEAHEAIGDYQWRVYTVLRTWTGSAVGEGDFDEIETEILPRPKVECMKATDRLFPSGKDEQDVRLLRYVSLTYTEAEVAGPRPRPDNEQWVIRMRDAYNQEIRPRDFVLASSPEPDRQKDIGWKVVVLNTPFVESPSEVP